MNGIIYKATNLINGKIYVGQTIQTLTARKRQHAKAREMFGQAIRKHGSENFCFEIVDTAEDKESLNAKEAHWIIACNSMSPAGYNLTTGGDAKTTFSPEVLEKMSASRLGKKCSAVAKAKISAANTGKTRSVECRAKMSEAAKNRGTEHIERLKFLNTGRTASPETKAKMSKAQTGRTAFDETRAKLVEVRKNRGPISDETRARMSESGKRRAPMTPETRAKLCAIQSNRAPISAEARAKITASKLGKKHSPETRAKMSASAKARKRRRAEKYIEIEVG